QSASRGGFWASQTGRNTPLLRPRRSGDTLQSNTRIPRFRGPMEPMLKSAAPQAAAPADLIKDSDQTKFAKDVLEDSRTVSIIVDFWAPWCGPCRTLQPMIEKVVTEAKGAVKLVKINIDQNKMLAQQLSPQSMPPAYP